MVYSIDGMLRKKHGPQAKIVGPLLQGQPRPAQFMETAISGDTG